MLYHKTTAEFVSPTMAGLSGGVVVLALTKTTTSICCLVNISGVSMRLAAVSKYCVVNHVVGLYTPPLEDKGRGLV
jgi:hypothetical protein|tara:strand:- start:1317 stop:1544 length:228 start_codon:yes stop_codon:yes gene_type:complete